MSGLDEARCAGLKSLMDRQQSALYSCQLPSRLCGQHMQQLLPRKNGDEPIILAKPFQGNLSVKKMKKKMRDGCKCKCVLSSLVMLKHIFPHLADCRPGVNS
jgi:hypothetical protein